MSGNIYLVGFMGTGKSAAGRVLARRLKRPFVDCDAEIERGARLPVGAIFARKGEKAFRALESGAVARIARRREIVAALGGGALLFPSNRSLLKGSGVIVALTCAQAQLWRRLRPHLSNRPLLAGGRKAFEALRRRRAGLDRLADMRVSTTGLTVAQAAAELERRLKRRGLA